MLSKRILPIFALASILLLAGCYRQAEESFEPIDSQSSEGQITLAPTDLPEETDIPVLVIDPNASEEPTATESVVVEQEEPTATEEEPTKEQEIVEQEASPTLRVIEPTATDVPSDVPNIVPTATEQTFITPEVIVEEEIPSQTPTTFVEQPTLEPTPTTLGDTGAEPGECEYVVQSGDTLFRIALNNDVSLADLLQANGLSEASIIQPEQVLTIPNCDATEEPEAVETEEELTDCDYVVQTGDTLFEIALNNEVALADLLEENELTEASIIQPEQVLRLPDCEDGESVEEAATATEASNGEIIHTVASGETLLSIARQYGVTVNDIVQANNIPNPNNLTIGQQLIIPTPEPGDE